MNIEVLKQQKEPLTKRSYFEAKVVFEGKTPSRLDMKKDLCAKLSSKDNVTVIRRIINDYGSERALLDGYVYDDEETLKRLENRYVLLRHLTKQEQQAEKEKTKAAKQTAAPKSKKK